MLVPPMCTPGLGWGGKQGSKEKNMNLGLW